MPAFSAAEIDAFREAGRISALARDWAARQIKPGVLLRQVQEGAEEQIRRAGAAPSFPAQTSRNDVAAHFCSAPDDSATFEDGDLVKLDVGAHVDGYPADTGITIDLSPDGRWSNLVAAAANALDGREFGITCGQLNPGNTNVERRRASGGRSASGRDVGPEPLISVEDMARAALYMATLPADANCLEMTVLPLQQVFLGRG